MAYIERYEDPSTRVELPRLTRSDFGREGEGTFVQFAGRSLPTGARAKRRPAKRWTMETTLARSEHHVAEDLDNLFEASFDDGVESRLTFVPNESENNNVNPETVGEVLSWEFGREPGGVLRLSFEVQEVDH